VKSVGKVGLVKEFYLAYQTEFAGEKKKKKFCLLPIGQVVSVEVGRRSKVSRQLICPGLMKTSISLLVAVAHFSYQYVWAVWHKQVILN
jgi:hypothetical protein